MKPARDHDTPSEEKGKKFSPIQASARLAYPAWPYVNSTASNLEYQSEGFCSRYMRPGLAPRQCSPGYLMIIVPILNPTNAMLKIDHPKLPHLPHHASKVGYCS